MQNSETFRSWLHAQLARKSWQPSDLSKASGLADSTWSRLLRGHSRSVAQPTVDALVRIFGISEEALYRISIGASAPASVPAQVLEPAGIYWPALSEWARAQPHLVQAALLAVARSHGFNP